MIQATARVLRNVIELQVGSENWVARPVPSLSAPIARQISALFATVYETFDAPSATVPRATVSYHAKKDEIVIQVDERKWVTHSSTFGPIQFEYEGRTYEIHEKLTGRFALFLGREMVGQGRLGFRSCQIDGYPVAIEGFLAHLAVGFLTRTLFWEMLR